MLPRLVEILVQCNASENEESFQQVTLGCLCPTLNSACRADRYLSSSHPMVNHGQSTLCWMYGLSTYIMGAIMPPQGALDALDAMRDDVLSSGWTAGAEKTNGAKCLIAWKQFARQKRMARPLCQKPGYTQRLPCAETNPPPTPP
jgi:hypothetical protein